MNGFGKYRKCHTSQAVETEDQYHPEHMTWFWSAYIYKLSQQKFEISRILQLNSRASPEGLNFFPHFSHKIPAFPVYFTAYTKITSV